MLTDRYIAALKYAARKHQHQKRKGTEIPYLSHLMSVSALVMEHGGDEDEAIAGLLHDIIEDVGAREMPVIERKFGARVLEITRGCTDSYEKRKPEWKQRKLDYIERLEAKADPGILLVSCCDKLHNATCILHDLERIGPAVFERFTASREGTLWYYETLAGVFSKKNVAPAKRLAGTVKRMMELSEKP